MTDETKTPAKPQAEAAKPQASFLMTVTEFCTSASATDKRVELLGAFHAKETKAGRTSDHYQAYASRLAEFAKQPA